MIKLLSRIFRPDAPAPTTARRSLDAAGGGRRWASDPGIGSLNADILGSGATVRRRAAYYHANNPYANRATAVLVSNLVGAGIVPQSEHPDPATRDAIDALWSRWSQVADAAGRLSFYAMQSLAVRSVVETGEAFGLLRTDGPDLRLQLLSSDQIDASLHRDIGNGRRIRAGVEIDDSGRPLAYHVLQDAPGDIIAGRTEAVRIADDQMIHVFEALAPGQIRGLPWLTSVLLRLHELDAYEDAQLVRQKVSALFTGFLIDPDGGAGQMFDGNTTAGTLTTGLEPGTIKVLPPGFDIKFSDPAETGNNYSAFIEHQLRAIAVGLGVTFEQLTGDMRGVNYSSARVALIEFRRRCEALQAQVIVDQLCRPVWRRLLELAVLRGDMPESAIDAPVRWVPPKWQFVDPEKDAQAEALQVTSGFKSRRQVILEMGYDPDKVDEELAADTFRREQNASATN